MFYINANFHMVATESRMNNKECNYFGTHLKDKSRNYYDNYTYICARFQAEKKKIDETNSKIHVVSLKTKKVKKSANEDDFMTTVASHSKQGCYELNNFQRTMLHAMQVLVLFEYSLVFLNYNCMVLLQILSSGIIKLWH